MTSLSDHQGRSADIMSKGIQMGGGTILRPKSSCKCFIVSNLKIFYLIISRSVSVLFSDNIKNWLLNMDNLIFRALHVPELCLDVEDPDLLHLQHLVVAGPVVEGVVPLGEVIHHVGRIEDGNPC